MNISIQNPHSGMKKSFLKMILDVINTKMVAQ